MCPIVTACVQSGRSASRLTLAADKTVAVVAEGKFGKSVTNALCTLRVKKGLSVKEVPLTFSITSDTEGEYQAQALDMTTPVTTNGHNRTLSHGSTARNAIATIVTSVTVCA